MLSDEELEAITRQPRARSAKVVQVIRVVTVEGPLVVEHQDGNRVREVTYYYTLDGALIARHDQADGERT